jgi:Ran GTPase-activating protein (RanGAP) involved in mRNA processing and transport
VIPVEEVENDSHLKRCALSAADVLASVAQHGAYLNLMLLDACSDKPSRMVRSARNTHTGLSEMKAPAGSALAFACAPGMTAADGDGRNGVFTANLLKHLTSPGLDVDKMLRAVAKGVFQDTRKQQDPYHNHNLREESVCLVEAAPPLRPTASSAGDLAAFLARCELEGQAAAEVLAALCKLGVQKETDLKLITEADMSQVALPSIAARKLRAGLEGISGRMLSKGAAAEAAAEKGAAEAKVHASPDGLGLSSKAHKYAHLMEGKSEFSLRPTAVEGAVASALAEALKVNMTVTSLDFGGKFVGDACARVLAASLKVNTTLTSLEISDSSVGDAGAGALAEVLQANTTLTSLHLYGNSVGVVGATALAQALEVNGTLTTLDLMNNSINAAGARALAGALKVNTTLTSLNDNIVGDVGALVLAESLMVNDTLTTLQLHGNTMSAQGAYALAAALKENTSLTTLDLSHNSVRASGTSALAQALKVNGTLTTLKLGYSSVGDGGVRALSEALKVNTTLLELALTNSNVGAAGGSALGDALKANGTLTTLGLSYNSVGDAGARALAEALKENTTLTSLFLMDNSISDAGMSALRASADAGLYVAVNTKISHAAATGCCAIS